jgi:exodeoxyribonuclease-5
MLTLSPDQTVAMEQVLKVLRGPRPEAVLAGAAGTGKTTTMSHVLRAWGGHVLFLAPTGKAAVRLSEQTGVKARTIHSAVYGEPEEVERQRGSRKENLKFGEPHAPEGCGPGVLVVVDEASMVNVEIARHVREVVLGTGAALLWVGDHEQLPPVEGGWGVALHNPTARLTMVHRQALESPVLELATLIREGKGGAFARWGGDCTRTAITQVDEAVAWAEEAPADRVLLTWTNAVRTKANRRTRKVRGYTSPLVAGEKVICTYNNHGLGFLNGETFTVESVEPHDVLTRVLGQPIVWVKFEGKPTRVLMAPSVFDAYRPRASDRMMFEFVWSPLMKKDGAAALMQEHGIGAEEVRTLRSLVYDFALMGTYAYCLTVHKSQGSQYPEVGFVSCPNFRSQEDRDFKRRLTYTAVTRAQRVFRAFTLTTPPKPEAKAA